MILFLDTSSLIKLYVSEPDSAEVEHLVARASTVAVSALAYVESRAVLARQYRARKLARAAYARLKESFEQNWASFAGIPVSAELVQAAADLAERHALRALDAIHLASFVQVLERAGDDDVHFLSFDARLSKAAKRLR